ncbi:hypothetical protein FRC12_003281, partial [Ceratobasidium sp. 428]
GERKQAPFGSSMCVHCVWAWMESGAQARASADLQNGMGNTTDEEHSPVSLGVLAFAPN